MRTRSICLAALLILPLTAYAQRSVAVTFDDLPFAGTSLDAATHATDALIETLATYDVTADVFVIGDRVEVEGETQARKDLLRRWRDAGHHLQNHSYSHLHYAGTDGDAYLRDVKRGYDVVEALLTETDPPAHVHFFRPPFNDLGADEAAHRALAAAVEARGVQIAPFTVEHSDWMFDALYEDALARGDSAQARRVGDAYLAQLDTAFTFAEQLSVDTFGREIPQVLLIHASTLNADYLGQMLERLKHRGYAFVTLGEAVADPAYTTDDVYFKKWGISWLHRWRVGLDLPNALRDEPEPPAWVTEAYQGLTAGS